MEKDYSEEPIEETKEVEEATPVEEVEEEEAPAETEDEEVTEETSPKEEKQEQAVIQRKRGRPPLAKPVPQEKPIVGTKETKMPEAKIPTEQVLAALQNLEMRLTRIESYLFRAT